MHATACRGIHASAAPLVTTTTTQDELVSGAGRAGAAAGVRAGPRRRCQLPPAQKTPPAAAPARGAGEGDAQVAPASDWSVRATGSLPLPRCSAQPGRCSQEHRPACPGHQEPLPVSTRATSASSLGYQLRRPSRQRDRRSRGPGPLVPGPLVPGPWAGAGQAALPAARLVEEERQAAGAGTQVRDLVKAQGGAVRASAVHG